MGTETVGNWLFGVALKKGATQGAIALITLVGADVFKGIELSTVQQVLAALVVGLLNVLRNWLKVKVGLAWL
jgi:hypothetical protein